MPHRLPGEKRFFSILLGAGADIKGQSGLYGSALQAGGSSFYKNALNVCWKFGLLLLAPVPSGINLDLSIYGF